MPTRRPEAPAWSCPRQLLEGAWYHIAARVNQGEMLLDRGEGKDFFLVLLASELHGDRANFRKDAPWI
jgi:hypothetical protein